ncbi:MAG: hypothetical protein ACYC6Y_29870 [Thermoguttaceae bacterium]
MAFGIFASQSATATEITVSPNVINIGSQSEVVTVHTDIPYSLVVGASVTLDGIDIAWWKSDNQGYFVAKFDAITVKDSLEPGTVELVLTGTTSDGVSFSGSDTVQVVDIKPKKK